MKLDGEKLLEDLVDIVNTLELAKEKLKEEEDYASWTKVESGLTTALEIKKLVESGSYTIEETK